LFYNRKGIKEINQDAAEEIIYINQTSKELDIFSEVLDRASKEVCPKQVETRHVCAYCQCDSEVNPRVKFFAHTVVPFKANGTPIELCTKCFKAFTFYRDKAIDNNILVLENERNEEICAICSASPAELILCVECPCSYCAGCLKKVLDDKEYEEMNATESWHCINCKYNSKQEDNNSRKKSKRVKKKNQSKNVNNNTTPRSNEKKSPSKHMAIANGKFNSRRNDKYSPSPQASNKNKINSISRSQAMSISVPCNSNGNHNGSVSTDAEKNPSLPSPIPSPTDIDTTRRSNHMSTSLTTKLVSPNSNK